jgi:hypothetical protein
VSDRQTGAPSDVEGGMPATDAPAATSTASATAADTLADPIATIDEAARGTFGQIAGHLIPAAQGMPSAADVVVADRLRFVLRARPDLLEPLRAALRADLGSDVAARLSALAGEPASLAALQLAIVAGYYSDRHVRELIGYPGQMAIEVKSWLVPPYIDEGLIDAVLARGPVWRDPSTGRRAVADHQPRTYAERFLERAAEPEGASHGRDRA